MKIIWVLFFAASIAACNNSGNTGHDDTDTSMRLPDSTAAHDTMTMTTDTSAQPLSGSAQAVLSGTKADTTLTGKVSFDTLQGGKVKMSLELSIPKMANKSVAVHLHEHGDCGDGGNASHGHWNPGNKKHGKWGTGEFHTGDIGNVKLDANGNGTMTLETDLWTIGGEWHKNILKKAVIVHSGMDDYATQPTGNAGSRIGCGVIQ